MSNTNCSKYQADTFQILKKKSNAVISGEGNVNITDALVNLEQRSKSPPNK